MKDNFSEQSVGYAQFRPSYPQALFAFLFEHCPSFERAWDCATGSGQMASVLAERFTEVEATDISENQLKNALPRHNIRYRLGRAEAPDFPDQSFDLITVGQAAHWFNFERFYPEAKRVMKPNALIALIGYQKLRVGTEVEALIEELYDGTLHGFWDAERRLVDERYAHIPFPFEEIAFPEMASEHDWTVHHLLGYLNTWSAVQHYVRQRGENPMSPDWVEALMAAWPSGETRTVSFPVFGRVGKNWPTPPECWSQ
jgi:SAM-dependent methyltransferase